jgi:hypothetical protein
VIGALVIGGVIALGTSGVGALSTSGVSTTAYAEVALPSWASSIEGVWYLEEGSTTTRASSGSCTTACGLARTGQTTSNTTNFMQGAASNTFDGVNDDLNCTNANCGTALGATSNVTFGCWTRVTAYPNNLTNATLLTRYTGTSGYALFLTWNTGVMQCTINSTTVVATTANATGTFAHLVCVFDDTANTVEPFRNGVSDKTAASVSTLSSGTATFNLGNNSGATQDYQGDLDECFVWKGAMTAAEVCRVCSCGIDGSLCTYNALSNAWANTGRNVSLCGSCTLPSNPLQSAP